MGEGLEFPDYLTRAHNYFTFEWWNCQTAWSVAVLALPTTDYSWIGLLQA